MLVSTLAITVLTNLVTAVAVGVGIAVVLALRSVSQSSRLKEMPLDTSDHDADERELLDEHIVAYRLDGPLFFAAAHRFLLELTEHLRRDHLIFADTPAAIAHARTTLASGGQLANSSGARRSQ